MLKACKCLCAEILDEGSSDEGGSGEESGSGDSSDDDDDDDEKGNWSFFSCRLT